MADPIKPLYDQMVASANALTAAQKQHDDNLAALVASMPEDVLFSTEADPKPLIKKVGDKLVAVTPLSIHLPYDPS